MAGAPIYTSRIAAPGPGYAPEIRPLDGAARGLGVLGAGLTDVGGAMLAAQQQTDVTAAETTILRRLQEAELAGVKSTDFRGAPDAFSAASKTILDEVTAGFSNEATRARLRAFGDRQVLAAEAKVKQAAWKSEADTNIANAVEADQLDYRRYMTAASDAERQAVLQSQGERWSGLEKSGWLTPQGALAKRQVFAATATEGWYTQMIAKDPATAKAVLGDFGRDLPLSIDKRQALLASATSAADGVAVDDVKLRAERFPDEAARLLGIVDGARATRQTYDQVVAPAAPIKADAAERARAAMSFFMGKGLTREQAAGIVGHGLWESGGFDPSNITPRDGSDGSDSIGVFQMNADRAQRMKAFAAARGRPWNDLESQLEWTWQELVNDPGNSGGALDKLRQARTVEEATAAWANYERPRGYRRGGDMTQIHGWGNRLAFAKKMADESTDLAASPLLGGNAPSMEDWAARLKQYNGRLAPALATLYAPTEKVDAWRAEAERKGGPAYSPADFLAAIDDPDIRSKVSGGLSQLQVEPDHYGMTPHGRVKAELAYRAGRKTYETELGKIFDVRMAANGQAPEDLARVLSNGGQVDPASYADTLGHLAQKAAGGDVAAARQLSDLHDAREVGATLDAAKALRPGELDAAITKLEAAIDGGVSTALDDKRLAKLKAVAADTKSRMGDDVVGLAADRGIVSPRPIGFDGELTPAGLAADLKRRSGEAEAAAAFYSAPPNPFTPIEADAARARFSRMTARDRAGFIGTLAGSLSDPVLAAGLRQIGAGDGAWMKDAVKEGQGVSLVTGLVASGQPTALKLAAKVAAQAFKDDALDAAARVDTVVASLKALPAADRPGMVRNLLEAGLPEIAEPALMVALRPGADAPARRLMEAALVDPNKQSGSDRTLIGSGATASISDAVYDRLLRPGSVGAAFYGVGSGDPEAMLRAQHAGELLRRSVELRARAGANVNAAADAAVADLAGDVVVAPSGNLARVNAVVRKDAPLGTVWSGFDGLMPKVREALEAEQLSLLRRALPREPAGPDDRAGRRNDPSQNAVLQSMLKTSSDQILREGAFVNVGSRFGFRDPFDGGLVSGPDGKPLTFSLDEVLAHGTAAAAAAKAKPDQGSTSSWGMPWRTMR
jgi:hypothetical protein